MLANHNASTNQSLKYFEKLEYLLLGDLRDLLEEPADEQTCLWMQAVLDVLLQALPRGFALEEENGYMTEVLEQYPNWHHEVDRLRHQHTTLYRKLKELRNRIANREEFSETAGIVRCELRSWMTAFIAHNRHENRLIQTAMNLEVGTGD